MSAPDGAPRLDRDAYGTDPVTLAKRLIGQRLVRVLEDGTRCAGRIVETEAYLGVPDAAAHSYRGRRTARTEPMFGEPGTAYVYFTYGMHHCMNVVCGRAGEPVAVLLRALEPEEGIERMREARGARAGRGARAPGAVALRALTSGPARLCEALRIDRTFSGVDLTVDARLFIEHTRVSPLGRGALVNTARIGIANAGDWTGRPLRWYLASSEHVSRPFAP